MNKEIQKLVNLASYIEENIERKKNEHIVISENFTFYNGRGSIKGWFYLKFKYHDIELIATPASFSVELPEHISIEDFRFSWILGDMWKEVKNTKKSPDVKQEEMTRKIVEIFAEYGKVDIKDIEEIHIDIKSSKKPRF